MTILVIRPCEKGPRWTCHRGTGGMMQIITPDVAFLDEQSDRKRSRGSWPSREAAIIGGIRSLFELRASNRCIDREMPRDEAVIHIMVQRVIGTTWGQTLIPVRCVEWIVCRSPDHPDCLVSEDMARACAHETRRRGGLVIGDDPTLAQLLTQSTEGV